MSFDWSQFSDVADQLAASPSDSFDSARQRIAVSRYYYAAFHCAMAAAERRGFYAAGASGGDHGLLRSSLKDSKDRVAGMLADLLKGLWEARRWADYQAGTEPEPDRRGVVAKIDLPTIRANAAKAIKLAKGL